MVPIRFLADELGAVSTDRLLLGTAALLLLGTAAYELFAAGFGSLVSTVDPGVARFAAEMELAVTENPGG